MAKDWILIRKDDLDDYLVAAQVTAIRTSALATAQLDPFENIKNDVNERIRAEIQGNDSNVLSATEHSVPPELKWVSCLLTLERLQNRIPTLKLTDDQNKSLAEAKDFLKRVAKGEIPVTEPTDPLEPGDMQGGGAAVIVEPDDTERKYRLDKQDGLL